jgi:hypothetical protein
MPPSPPPPRSPVISQDLPRGVLSFCIGSMVDMCMWRALPGPGSKPNVIQHRAAAMHVSKVNQTAECVAAHIFSSFSLQCWGSDDSYDRSCTTTVQPPVNSAGYHLRWYMLNLPAMSCIAGRGAESAQEDDMHTRCVQSYPLMYCITLIDE